MLIASGDTDASYHQYSTVQSQTKTIGNITHLMLYSSRIIRDRSVYIAKSAVALLIGFRATSFGCLYLIAASGPCNAIFIDLEKIDIE